MNIAAAITRNSRTANTERYVVRPRRSGGLAWVRAV
jgi:hypothetical protein